MAMRSKCALIFVVSVLFLDWSDRAFATDCNGNGTDDSLEIGTLYVGTQGGLAPQGGGAKVYEYKNGQWLDLTPQPPWDVSTVMSLAVFDGHLYAGVQTEPGFGASGEGQVWRHDGDTGWSLSQTLDNSVSVLLVYAGKLYATSYSSNPVGMAVWRYDGSSWVQLARRPGGTGFRAGITTTRSCGEPEIVLGGATHDDFWRFTRTAGLNLLVLMEGSCIFSLSEYQSRYDQGRLYGGAYAGVLDYNGPVYVMPPDLSCNPASVEEVPVALSTRVCVWALQAYKGKLYIGGAPPNDPTMFLQTYNGSSPNPTPTGFSLTGIVYGDGVSALAADKLMKLTRT